MEVEQELDDVLNGLSQSARRDPRRYGALWALVQRGRRSWRRAGIVPPRAHHGDSKWSPSPFAKSPAATAARCMTCVLDQYPSVGP